MRFSLRSGLALFAVTVAVQAVAEPTIDQIAKFRLELIPSQLQDPSRAFHFIASNPSGSGAKADDAFKGTTFSFLKSSTNNVAVAVSHGDSIATAFNYQAKPEIPLFAYSVTKFVTGFLVADQICSAKLNYSDKMGDLSPSLRDTGYKNITLVDVLNMSSGVYKDAQKYTVKSYQEVTRKGVTMLEQLKRRPTPNIQSNPKWDYSNFDSNALAFALEDVTGSSIGDLFHEKIWSQIDSDFDGFWLKDSANKGVGAFGLALSASDFVKVGKFLSSRINSEPCLNEHYSGEGIVIEGDRHRLSNWNKHSWKNPNNVKQFGGMGYGGQILVLDLETKAVAFIYSHHMDGYKEDVWKLAWSLLDESN
jgi:CubicO group peptidase (beta-lactamase class C family)